MLTRMINEAPEQDDLFSEEMSLLLANRVVVAGNVLVNVSKQQAVPAADTPCLCADN